MNMGNNLTAEKLESLRDLRRTARVNDWGTPSAFGEITVNGRPCCISDLIRLAQMAVLPDEWAPDEQAVTPPDENSFIGHYGEWTTFKGLPTRALFEDKHGQRYAKSGYYGWRIEVNDDNDHILHSQLGRVRQIHLPEPQPQPPEPSLDERAWETIQIYANAGYKDFKELMAEKEAQEGNKA